MCKEEAKNQRRQARGSVAPRELPTPPHFVELALQIAARAHAGAVDKAGAPYLWHPVRVAERLAEPEEKAAALLHDVLEDTDLTPEDLLARGIPAEVVRIVGVLTRRHGETYPAFIERVAGDARSTRVKLADLADNMDPERVRALPEKARGVLGRYEEARARLLAAG